MIDPVPPDIRPLTRMRIETDRWLVGVPQTYWAMAWWGAFTDWCVAADDGAFGVYARQGPLVVFRPREGGGRWLLHPVTGEFRNRDNKRASWRGFLMRNPEVSDGVMGALATQP